MATLGACGQCAVCRAAQLVAYLMDLLDLFVAMCHSIWDLVMIRLLFGKLLLQIVLWG